MKDIKRVIYGNKQNDNSPKMTIRELNPEENGEKLKNNIKKCRKQGILLRIY